MTQTIGDGRYRLGETIGYGGMATVYQAEDSRLGRTVAVKVLADNLAADPKFRERFLREARLAARLGHRNVVHVFDVGEADDRPFIVMECVDGGTLADVLARGPMSPARVADVARQVAEGLAHAHAAGLVHRDIKPGNLLLAKDGTVKIGDFGIARAVDSATLTRTGAVIGTAAYLSPEQAAGLPTTAATDIYAFGVVLHEALTGRRLPAGTVAPVPGLEGAPQPLRTSIDRALAENPADRPPAADIAAALGGTADVAPDLPATDPDQTAELPATAVLAADAGTTPAAGTAVLPAAAAAASTRPYARRRARALVAIAAAAMTGALLLALAANRHDTNAVRSSSTTTAVPTTSTTPTTVAAVVPSTQACGDINLNYGGVRVSIPNYCTNATADTEPSTDVQPPPTPGPGKGKGGAGGDAGDDEG